MTAEVLLAAAFAAGFFGSTHCFAMCGAIVLLFEGPARAGALPRRLACNAGRMAFYVLLGSVAGASGALLLAGFEHGLSLLRVLAGALIVLLGLNLTLDWQALRFLEEAGALIWKRLAPLARRVLPVRSIGTAAAAGFVWGALPCGLVYSAVALAATSGGGVSGGLVMLAFWLGTLPALLLAGASAGRLQRLKSRGGLRRVAGAVLILFGALSLVLPFLHSAPAGHRGHDVAPTPVVHTERR